MNNRNDIDAFFARLHALGIRVSLDESGALRVKGKKEHLDSALVAELKARKQDINEHLKRKQALQAGEDQARRHHLIHTLNDNRLSPPEYDAFADMTLHGLVEAQAADHPEWIALSYPEIELSYAKLNALANQWAYYLRREGVSQETPVGLHVDNSELQIILMLAVLKAGGAYICLDPSLNGVQCADIVAQADIEMLLSDRAQPCEVPLLIRVDEADVQKAVACCASVNLPLLPEQSAFSLACVIFTLDSDGNNKGVMVEHGNIIRLANWPGNLSLGVGQKVAQTANHSFAPALLEVWGTLAAGGTVCGFDMDCLTRPGGLADHLDEQQITVLSLPQSWLEAIAEHTPGILADLPLLTIYDTTGQGNVQDLLKRAGPVQNAMRLFGPAENAPFTTALNLDTPYADTVVGTVLTESGCFVLDDADELVKQGEQGRLHVSGLGLARGYLNDLALSDARFKPNPFADDPNDRLFDTGLLACHLPNGYLQLVSAPTKHVHPVQQMLNERWQQLTAPMPGSGKKLRRYSLGQISWQSEPFAALAKNALQQEVGYLIFVDSFGIGRALAERLGDAAILIDIGERFVELAPGHFQLAPDSCEDMALLLNTLQAKCHSRLAVVQLWCLDGMKVWADNEPFFEQIQRFERYQQKGLKCLKRLFEQTQALAGLELTEVTMVTHDTLSVTADEDLCPFTSTAAALQSAPFPCYHIDLSLPHGGLAPTTLQQLGSFIHDELRLESRRPVVAFRGKQRWIPHPSECHLNGSTANVPQSGHTLVVGDDEQTVSNVVEGLLVHIPLSQIVVLGPIDKLESKVAIHQVDLSDQTAMAQTCSMLGAINGVVFTAGLDDGHEAHARRLMVLGSLYKQKPWPFTLILLGNELNDATLAANRFSVSFAHSQGNNWSCVGAEQPVAEHLAQWFTDWLLLSDCAHLHLSPVGP